MARGLAYRVSLAVITALIAVACGQGVGTSASRLSLSACTVQGLRAECGKLSVPENPIAPTGRKISLNVVVLPAKGADRAPDPLFYLEGGPGGAATTEVSWAAVRFDSFNQRHDVVFIDQRGTGGSNPVSCPTTAVYTEAAVEALMQSCLASIKDKADPVYYTTPVAVDDFDRVRAALGYDKIDIYGISYGVSSGLAYIQRHGDHVRAAVLDSGSLLDYHLWEQVPKSAQQALNMLFDRCRSDEQCNSAFPNLSADFQTVTARLAQSPVEVGTVDPSTGSLYRLDLTQFLGLVIDGYLASPDGVAVFPKDIHAAAKGDWSAIEDKAVNRVTPSSASLSVMRETISCSDEWASLDPERVASVAPGSPFTQWEVWFATGQQVTCKYWPHAVGAGGPVKSSAPIVFLNAASDPVDPPVNVAGAAADMPNSLVVPVEGTGHWQLDYDPTRCLATKTNTFLELGQKSTLAAWSCPSVQPPFALA